MGKRLWPIISIFCLSAAGCAGSDTVLRKQVQMEGTIEEMTRQEQQLAAQVAELSRSLADVQRRVKGAEGDLDALRPAYEQLKASNDSLYQKLAELSPATALHPQESPALEPQPHDAVPSQPGGGSANGGQEAYARAFAVFSQGDLPAAIKAFEAFVRAEPQSEFAPNAVYWTGECYYAQKRYDTALSFFQRVVQDYPKSHKVPDAMLKLGFTLLGMKETARARGELLALVEKYPKSPAAAKAKEKLGRL